MTSSLPIFYVNAFARGKNDGNPAAVCLLRQDLDAGSMQYLATAIHLSETAFVDLRRHPYGLRWFTPRCEVDLCGHATLAAAHVLLEENLAAKTEDLVFQTRSSPLKVRCQDDRLVMDFPADPVSVVPGLQAKMSRTFGVPVLFAGKGKFDYLFEIEDVDVLRGLKPDLDAVRKLPVRGVIVTCRAQADSAYDFFSRFFAPQSGIDEDPVTGSAHCSLACYWSGLLDKRELTAFQASDRGGELRACLNKDRVLLGGRAVAVKKETREYDSRNQAATKRK